MNIKPTAVGSQTFAGGMLLGVSKYFEVMATLEWDKYGTDTLRHNFPELPIIIGSKQWSTYHPSCEVDLLFGNPPCAAWSQNNPAARDWRNSPYLARTRAHLDLLKRFKPQAWVTESVPGAWKNGRSFFLGLADDCLDLGYAVTFVLHDAQYLGLPQKRPRMFMVAHRVDIPWDIPNPKTVYVPDTLSVLNRRDSSGEPVTRNSHTKLLQQHYADLHPGERLRDLFDRHYPEPELKANGHVLGRPSFCEYRLPINGPANTMSGSYTLIHPTEHRACTLDEIKGLCGYPSWYEFVEGGQVDPARTGVLSQLARAVMPTVAEWLAKQIAVGIHQNIDAHPQLNLIDFRTSDVIDLHPWMPDHEAEQLELLQGGQDLTHGRSAA